MHPSVYELKQFYDSPLGRTVKRVLGQRIRTLWPNLKGQRVLGIGYAMPYLEGWLQTSERVIAAMPASMGARHWPSQHSHMQDFGHAVTGKKFGNLTMVVDDYALPIEPSSVDRIILIHNFEFAQHPEEYLEEVRRVLKANGRLLVIVPNRTGLWARGESSPFGHGHPYSVSQICRVLEDAKFIHERRAEALFMPPVEKGWILKSAPLYEYLGRTYLPMVAGVHMIEVSKQLYARAGKGGGTPVLAKGRRFLAGATAPPKPVPSGFKG